MDKKIKKRENACVGNGLWLWKLQTLVKTIFANKMIMFEKALELKQAIILSYWWHLTMICRKSSKG
jgi:hypothetical protein